MKQSLVNFFGWWARSFSGDGDVSSRRLTAFAVACVYVASRVWYFLHVADAWYQLMGFIVDALFILLLFGIITLKEVIELKNGTPLKPAAE